jgi:hypothetical protein
VIRNGTRSTKSTKYQRYFVILYVVTSGSVVQYVDQLPNCYLRLCNVQSLKTMWKDGTADLDLSPYLLRSLRCLLFFFVF